MWHVCTGVCAGVRPLRSSPPSSAIIHLAGVTPMNQITFTTLHLSYKQSCIIPGAQLILTDEKVLIPLAYSNEIQITFNTTYAMLGCLISLQHHLKSRRQSYKWNQTQTTSTQHAAGDSREINHASIQIWISNVPFIQVSLAEKIDIGIMIHMATQHDPMLPPILPGFNQIWFWMIIIAAINW